MTVVHKKREQENEHKHTTEREERRETEGGREGGRGGGKNGAGIGRRESNSIFTRWSRKTDKRKRPPILNPSIRHYKPDI